MAFLTSNYWDFFSGKNFESKIRREMRHRDTKLTTLPFAKLVSLEKMFVFKSSGNELIRI